MTYKKTENSDLASCCKVAVVLLKNFASSRSKHSKTLGFFTYLCAWLAVLGSTNPTVVFRNLGRLLIYVALQSSMAR
jgi:hypothetical protein